MKACHSVSSAVGIYCRKLASWFCTVALALIIYCTSAAAQVAPLEYVFGRSAFPASNRGVVIAVGDFNGDGILDLASVAFDNFGQSNLIIQLGQPKGSFVETTPVTFLEPINAAVTGDFNGDGKLDLAITRTNQVTVLLGNGDGTFGEPESFSVNGFPVNLIAEDFNRDGHLDLAVTVAANNISTASPGVVAILLGNGDGTFKNEIDSAAGIGVRDLVAGDFNGDHILDLAVVNAPAFNSNTISLLIGKGDGTFNPAQSLTVAGEPTAIQVADFNKDGKLDLAVATATVSSANGDGLISVLLGNGNGTFQPRTDVSAGGGIDSMVVTDLNHDGNPDIVADTPLSFNGSASVLLGNGDGTFQSHQEYEYGGLFGRLYAEDFNGDGKVDIGVANGKNGLLVLLGKGNGQLAGAKSVPTGESLPTAIISGDINNDGLTDLVAVNTASTNCPSPDSSVSVFFSKGDGNFGLQAIYLTGNGPSSAALGDFRGRGHLDLAVVNGCDNTVSVLLNNGDGSFASRVDYPTGNGPSALVAGDFNQDGITDLAVTNTADNTVSILLGKGDGTFKPKADLATGPGPTAIVAADFNGDGKLDLVTADSNTALTLTDTGKVSVLLGNGSGAFRRHAEISLNAILTPEDLAVGDFNHDGKVDLAVVANRNAIGGVITLNGKGDGTFFPPSQFFSTGRLSARAAVADFDGDGILDLAVTSFGEGTATLLKGNGDGSFSPKGTYGGTGLPAGITAADFNGDNFPDIAFVNSSANTVSTYLSVPPKEPDFTLTVTPPSATVSVAGPTTAIYEVSVTGRAGFNQTVSFSCSGEPVNSNCIVSPGSVTVSGQFKQTVTVAVVPSSKFRIPLGTYAVTVRGTSGKIQHDVSVAYMSRQ